MRGNEPTVPAFGGIAGRVLRGTLSAGTLLSGLTLVFLLGILGYILRQFEAGNAQVIFLQIGVILALARFARNGLAGEWNGTLFSSPGGSWLLVALVGLRYAALNAVWWVPMFLLGWRPEAVAEAIGQVIMGGGASLTLSLTTLVVTFSALTPPVFLIVSVGAERFLDIASPRVWRRLFSGRSGDLFLVYAVYLGGLAMAVILLLPVFTALAFQNMDLAKFLGFFALSFTVGLSLDLLGRLSGFFAASAETDLLPEMMPTDPDTTLTGTMTEPFLPVAPVATRMPSPTAAAATVPAAGTSAAGTSVSPAPRHPGKTPLLDARERLDEIERRLQTDPEGAMNLLAELRQAYAPHPLVLHRLCLALAQHGYAEESLEVAREALPLCMERGAVRLAAEVFAAHLDHTEAFGISRDTVLTLAQDLRRHGDLPGAECAFAEILDRDRGEVRALKGLIQVAEAYLERSENGEARRLFLVLLECAGESPLAMHIRAGLASAERRLAKAS